MTSHRRDKTIALDFDGVIHKYSKGWHDGTVYDDPVDGAVQAIHKLQEEGYKVVVLTSRTDTVAILHWLQNRDVFDVEVTNTKVPAIAYVDDRAIRFTNWTDILKYFG